MEKRTSGNSLAYQVFSLMPYNQEIDIKDIAKCMPGVSPGRVGKTLSMLKLRYRAVEMIRSDPRASIWKRVLEEYPRPVTEPTPHPLQTADVKFVRQASQKPGPCNNVTREYTDDALENALNDLLEAADHLTTVARQRARSAPDEALKAENERLKAALRKEFGL